MAIAFQNVTKRQNRPNGETLTILDNVSFSLDGATRVVILGPSGAGKTSILRLINRLDEPDSGTILLDGVDTRTLYTPDLRRRVGMVFQQPFLSDATVRENLNRPLSLMRRPDLAEDEAQDILTRVNLPVNLLDVSAKELSIGQQQRVAIARALVLKPQVLLLDEPTSALDPRSSEIILATIRDRADSLGITVIMVSHTLEQAAAFAEKVLAVRDGEVRLFDDVSSAVDWSMPAEATEGTTPDDA